LQTPWAVERAHGIRARTIGPSPAPAIRQMTDGDPSESRKDRSEVVLQPVGHLIQRASDRVELRAGLQTSASALNRLVVVAGALRPGRSGGPGRGVRLNQQTRYRLSAVAVHPRAKLGQKGQHLLHRGRPFLPGLCSVHAAGQPEAGFLGRKGVHPIDQDRREPANRSRFAPSGVSTRS